MVAGSVGSDSTARIPATWDRYRAVVAPAPVFAPGGAAPPSNRGSAVGTTGPGGSDSCRCGVEDSHCLVGSVEGEPEKGENTFNSFERNNVPAKNEKTDLFSVFR